LEYDWLALLESDYKIGYEDFLKMPCSRRHRLIKMREMVVDAQKGRATDLADIAPVTNFPTGLTNQNQQATPLFGGSPEG
jgi:hypothetical protein